MIPKIIHYCWLSGDPYPLLVNKCIQSWRKKMPDYEFMLWDSHRINVKSNMWLMQAYENKKYAFAADYIRFYALYNYGGIYLDADVEVLRPFDLLLDNDTIIGEEASGDIEAAVIGVEKNSTWIKECLDYYADRPFVKADGSFDMKPVPLLVGKVLEKHPRIKIYPYTYFSPKNYNMHRIDITSETYCIHHFDGKWVKKGRIYKVKNFLHRVIYLLFGRVIHNRIVHVLRRFS